MVESERMLPASECQSPPPLHQHVLEINYRGISKGTENIIGVEESMFKVWEKSRTSNQLPPLRPLREALLEIIRCELSF